MVVNAGMIVPPCRIRSLDRNGNNTDNLLTLAQTGKKFVTANKEFRHGVVRAAAELLVERAGQSTGEVRTVVPVACATWSMGMPRLAVPPN